MSARKLRILCFTSLYPNAAQPHHGIFVENRLRHLLQGGAVEAVVVAPVPWFPSSHPRFGGWADFARAPKFEKRFGIEIHHPRFPVIPKIGMTIAPALMAACTLPLVRHIQQGWDFDLIDAHYFYPDGVAAARIASRLGKPLVITARGTDLTLIPRFAGPRRQIVAAARQADGLVTVCAALMQPLLDFGITPDKITPLRNGVDLVQFRPQDRAAARRRWQTDRPTLLSVGHLIERKGHHLIIDAMAELPDLGLLIAGDGPLRGPLEAQIAARGLADRVRLLGAVEHSDLRGLYQAADLLVLASSREGWANVLLEAMACGTPVAATDVWGTNEVVAAPEAGVLIPKRTVEDIVIAVRRILAVPPDRAATRRYAEKFDWSATSKGQIELFSTILAQRR
jgi:glycosyltransferase involved in cell wall biosynthesis